MKMHFISLDSLCFCRNQLVAYENELDLVINKEGIMCTNETRDRVSIDTSDRHLDRPTIDLCHPSVDMSTDTWSTLDQQHAIVGGVLTDSCVER